MEDAIDYVESAKSLAAMEGYQRDGQPETIWPPGYPLALALPLMLGLDSILVFKFINNVFSAAALVFFYLAIRRFKTDWEALLIVALLGVFYPWVHYAQSVLSEPLFSLVLALFLFFASRYAAGGARRDLAGLTAAAMVAPLVRLAGIAVLPAWGVAVFLTRREDWRPLFRGRWRPLVKRFLLVPIVLLPIAWWFGRNLILSGSLSGYNIGMDRFEYVQSLNSIGITEFGFWTRMRINIVGYVHIFAVPDQQGITRISGLPLAVCAASWAFWAVAGLGWAACLLRPHSRVPAAALASHLGMHALLGWYDVRLIVPVMVLVFLCLYEGTLLLVRAVARLPALRPRSAEGGGQRPAARAGGVLLVAAVVLNLCVTLFSTRGRNLRRPDRDGGRRFYQACRFLRNREPPGAVLFGGHKPGYVRMWCDRPVRSAGDLLDADGKLRSPRLPAGVRFLILYEAKITPYHEQMAALVEENRDRLEPVFDKGSTVVYEVRNRRSG
ncbi:ArnT family glycosyltransferase [Verrucomicrobiota bacterium]